MGTDGETAAGRLGQSTAACGMALEFLYRLFGFFN
jgi:hypothetical protein